jgi:hypothetical protein
MNIIKDKGRQQLSRRQSHPKMSKVPIDYLSFFSLCRHAQGNVPRPPSPEQAGIIAVGAMRATAAAFQKNNGSPTCSAAYSTGSTSSSSSVDKTKHAVAQETTGKPIRLYSICGVRAWTGFCVLARPSRLNLGVWISRARALPACRCGITWSQIEMSWTAAGVAYLTPCLG